MDLPPATSRPSGPLRSYGPSRPSGPFCRWEAAGAPGAALGNRSQFVTGSQKHRDPRFPPYACTEHGATMAANALKNPQAAQMTF
jgi:hypothetical protein